MSILKTKPSNDYELLDSGDGEKLERYGQVIISRPDPQALWSKLLSVKEWRKAGAVFSRDEKAGWKTNGKIQERWKINFSDLSFYIKLSPFKHTGLFPEQVGNWEWIRGKIRNTTPLSSPSKGGGSESCRKLSVLNLFGYTGGATLACAQAGAEVCHVDASKTAVAWARENAEISGLADKPIRWILDDAMVFVKREIKRGRKYDGIIMDPPAFGHGPKGEMWKIEENFIELLDLCYQVLSVQPLFFLINGYASGYSSIAYENNLLSLLKKYGGEIEKGELAIAESSSGRLLPCGIFARWFKI